MSRRLATREAYRLWAPIWDTFASPIVQLEHRHLTGWLQNLEGKTFLDIGCGTGRWMTHAHAQGARVAGVDLSLEMLQHALGKPGLRGRIALADMAHMPLANESADVVLCALALGHHPDPMRVLDALLRLTRHGGLLILTDFHPEAIRNGWKRTFEHEGESIEVESYPYEIGDVLTRSEISGYSLEQLLEVPFGPAEEQIFIDAGRADLLPRVRNIPAVALIAMRRQ